MHTRNKRKQIPFSQFNSPRSKIDRSIRTKREWKKERKSVSDIHSFHYIHAWEGKNVCLFVCLFACLFVCLFICLFVSFKTKTKQNKNKDKNKTKTKTKTKTWVLVHFLTWHSDKLTDWQTYQTESVCNVYTYRFYKTNLKVLLTQSHGKKMFCLSCENDILVMISPCPFRATATTVAVTLDKRHATLRKVTMRKWENEGLCNRKMERINKVQCTPHLVDSKGPDKFVSYCSCG